MKIESDNLRLSGIRHAFFTRAGGISEGLYATLNGGLGSRDEAVRVKENRARMAAAVGVDPAQFVSAYQVHSADAAIAVAPWSSQARPRADAIATRTPGLAVAVTTADCGPVLLAEPRARVIAAAHAGWRGALSGIVEATVSAMERLGAERSRIRAAIGPMIRQPNYEVGPELIARFTAADPTSERLFRPAPRTGHALFDLAGYVAERLAQAGVSHVHDVGLCTYGDAERFFSFRRSVHRAEGDYGRLVSAIALVED
jgi:polyphenol oxidase